MLIRGHKFDLRFYVCVPSLDPLRIYLYKNGLVRLAVDPYCAAFDDFGNLCAHLTNFSINKENAEFKVTNEMSADGTGNKWSFEPFWPFLESLGFDSEKVRRDVEDAIVIVVMAGRQEMLDQKNHRCSFEMYGFDVLLDADGRIHVLEVNISPALGVTSALDRRVKTPLVKDFLNLALIPERSACSERIEEIFTNPEARDLARFIAVVEMEMAETRRGQFERIYPVPERVVSHRMYLEHSTDLDAAVARYVGMPEEKKESYFRRMTPVFEEYMRDLIGSSWWSCAVA
jgi:hypothetical protein